jgi:segregation and condensation protein B
VVSLKQKIESLLFVAGRPVDVKDLARFAKAMIPAVKDAVDELGRDYAQGARGMQVVQNGDEVQLVSHGDARSVTEPFLKEDIEGNLSRAALETLAIIAYRQPITRPEIDFIRGVNSTIMLRNLLMRGLVDRERARQDARMFEYKVSFDLLKLLGIAKVQDLPDFAALNQSQAMKLLEKNMQAADAEKADEASDEPPAGV